ncbi:MAG: response regulator transcription factor [Polaromonas sp.]
MSILLIDEHPLVREALAALVHRVSPAATVYELPLLSAVSAEVEENGIPELICMELAPTTSNGITGLRQLRQQFSEVPIIVFTALSAHDYEDLAVQAGASAYIQKSASSAEIAGVLREFLGSPEVDGETVPIEKLSKRQKQLLVLLDKGMSNRDIAEKLEISEHTVKVHLWRLFRRLNVKSRSQASHLARVQGLLQ